jgi:hypothetical protein
MRGDTLLYPSISIKLKSEVSLEFNKNLNDLINNIVSKLDITNKNYLTELFLNNIRNFTITQHSNFSCSYEDIRGKSFNCNISGLNNTIQELIDYIKNKNGGVLPNYIYLNISAEFKDNNDNHPSLEEIKNNSNNVRLIVKRITAVQKK